MERHSHPARILLTSAATVLLLACCFAGMLHWRHTHPRREMLPSLPAAFSSAIPQRVLWAWEEPEDLRTASPSVGVAYLAETLVLSDSIAVLPRRQPLIPAPNAPMMAVVRIETSRGFADSAQTRSIVAAQLARFAKESKLRALQIDFDATASQRVFYSGMLRTLRPQLPPGLPLSITALISWCGPHSWLHTLPLDEAVPMFFRMGGPRAIAGNSASQYQLVEPLCRTSLGVATDEPWPSNVATLNPSTRIYLFAPRPWQDRQLATIATTSISSLSLELSR
jgi:hypothetical protein